jgi:ribosomal protein L11 methyltransferase
LRSPERWFVLSARVPAVDLREVLGEGLLALGGLSVLDEGEQLTTYLPPPDDPDAYLREAERFLAEWLMEDLAPILSWRWQASEDWEREWKRGLAPRRVSERLVVKPSWTEWEAAEGEVVLEIDPEMAFGTGEHATTRGCLRLLDRHLRAGDRVLDVGSGSAILAIAAARLGASDVLAVEYDPDANLNALDNIRRNRAEGRVRLLERMADEELLRSLGRFDLVVANILSGVIRPLLPAFQQALGGSPAGRLLVSGILQTESPAVLADAGRAGFRLLEVDEEEEWWSAVLAPQE